MGWVAREWANCVGDLAAAALRRACYALVLSMGARMVNGIRPQRYPPFSARIWNGIPGFPP